MEPNYTPESFKKGQQFEQFVEEKIFTEDCYELITRTNSYEQNSNRYAEDTLKPDFKFRCKETGQEFWVEAKYRSEFFQDQIEALNFGQRERFYILEKEEGIPVFIIIGYWGYAYKPYAISLIPLKKYEHLKLYRSFLKRYDLPIRSTSNKKLGFKNNTRKETETETESRCKIDQQKTQEEKKPETKNYLKNYSSKILGLAAIGLIAIILTIYSFAFPEESSINSPEEQLKEIVENYYQAMNSNQVEKLPEFLSSNIQSWYGATNISLNEIMKIARDHRGRYPFSSSEIDWNSFKVVTQENGDYYVSYKMIYKSKKKITDDYRVYNLSLITHWDEDFKLKSIREIKL